MDIQFNRGNGIQADGDLFALAGTHAKHILGGEGAPPAGQKSFGQMLFDAIGTVNNDQQFAHDISIQAVSDPNSIEPHDVTIAMAQANLSLSITKNVIDRVIQAYRDITTLR